VGRIGRVLLGASVFRQTLASKAAPSSNNIDGERRRL